MRYDEWAPFYARIVQEFGFSVQRDEQAAAHLAALLAGPGYDAGRVWQESASRLQGQDVMVVGAADGALETLRRHRKAEPVVAADGATTACLEADILPTLIVTDLDGTMPDEVHAAEQGSLLAVHAHADNRPAVDEWLARIPKPRVAGTCQTRPVAPLVNHGGFTDGDRACFIAHALGARRLRLAGFSFDAGPGRYTGRFDPRVKPKKLAWARLLLDELARRGAIIEFV